MDNQNNTNDTMQTQSQPQITHEEPLSPPQEPIQDIPQQNAAPNQQFYAPYGAPQYIPTEPPKKGHKGLIAIIIIAAIVVVAAAITLFFILKPPAVEDISFVRESIELRVDETAKVVYTITPAKANERVVSWTTSNESVAVISEDGIVSAVGEGTCKIIGTVGGKTDTLDVVVKSGPDFEAVYDEYCESDWATLARDGSYLSVDTNPDNIDDYYDIVALLSIPLINEALGLPESLWEDMNHTRALDGRQTADFDDITVSWSYHPDNGLQITYKAK